MKAAKFVSNYLSANSLKDKKPVRVTIQSVAMEEVGQGKEEKLVIYFKELDQGFIPPKTSLKFLFEDTGTDETDEWVGRQYELFFDKDVSYQGKRCGGIRLRALEAAAK